jgi:hypothetical protein
MSHLTFTSQDKSTSGALMVHVDAFSMVYGSDILLQCMARNNLCLIRAFDKELNGMRVV